jgi:hypothetical protein
LDDPVPGPQMCFPQTYALYGPKLYGISIQFHTKITALYTNITDQQSGYHRKE